MATRFAAAGFGAHGDGPRAEALLFNAARAQIVGEVILAGAGPRAAAVCDRYADSTLAYQGYGHGQSIEALRRLGEFATGGLVSDLTVYLDIDVETGLRRKQSQDADAEWNRMEETLASARRARWLSALGRRGIGPVGCGGCVPSA
ncbi:MAG: dTMP kinase [Caldilineaceae bacterium]